MGGEKVRRDKEKAVEALHVRQTNPRISDSQTLREKILPLESVHVSGPVHAPYTTSAFHSVCDACSHV
jgi:hypothetical protein